METKTLLTKVILETITTSSNSDSIVINDALIKSAKTAWWFNPSHENRSFRLTDKGAESFNQAEFKFYKVDLPKTLFISNRVMLWADRYIDCPYYYHDWSIYVSREKVAVQLVLFGGDLYKFGASIEKSKKNQNSD